MQALFEQLPDLRGTVELVLAGAVRHESDQGRLDKLKELAAELGIADSVRFEINVSFPRELPSNRHCLPPPMRDLVHACC